MIKKRKKLSIVLAISGVVLASGAAGSYVALRHHPRYVTHKQIFDISQTAKKEGEITVMSCNVRCFTPTDMGKRNWYYRADLIIKNITRTAPDIIGFQEVTATQQKYLSETLQGYDYVIQYRNDSPVSEACPVYYRADQYSLIDKGSFWLSETPEKESKDWGAACYRICSYTILEEKSSGRQFVVFNTHLDHVSDEARVKGIGVVLDKIAQFGNLPAMIMGDFNAYEDSETYEMATDNFLDTKYQTQNTMDSATYQSWGEALDAPCIDYIMISKTGFTVDKYFVQTDTYDGVYPSDHFPVCTVLRLSGEEQ